jgi:hypothetical protein
MPARQRITPARASSSQRPSASQRTSRPRRRNAPQRVDFEPINWGSPLEGGWGQPADWGAPSPAAGWNAAEWRSPAADWGEAPTWDIAEVITPDNENSVFTERWLTATSSLVPFWAQNVDAASREEATRPLSDFLDELEQNPDQNIWRGIRTPREKWSVPAPEHGLPASGRRTASEWGSDLHSRPRTPSPHGQDRERSKASKLAHLDRKGIYWDEPDLEGPPPLPRAAQESSKHDTSHTPIHQTSDSSGTRCAWDVAVTHNGLLIKDELAR